MKNFTLFYFSIFIIRTFRHQGLLDATVDIFDWVGRRLAEAHVRPKRHAVGDPTHAQVKGVMRSSPPRPQTT